MRTPDDALEKNERHTWGWRGRLLPAALVVVAAALVVLVALMPRADESTPVVETPRVNVKVELVAGVPQLPDAFTLSAVVEPNRVVRVAAEVAGRVERLGRRQREANWRGRLIPAGKVIEEGEPIAEGDPIVHLNTELLQARFDRAAAEYEYDRTEFQRIEDLRRRGVTSEAEFDDARMQRDVSSATRDEAARNLARADIMAPISGILNGLPIEVGEYASPGQQVAEIVDVEKVKVVAEVPERDVHYLNVGDRAEVIAGEQNEMTLTGEISYISELADDQARTTRLEVKVDNRDQALHSGQIVRLRLIRRVLTDVIMIPLGSVIPLEHGRLVYVVNGEQAKRRDVELGLIKGRRVQVLSGLQPGDRLIVSGHRYVGPGQLVAVVEEQRPTVTTRPQSQVPPAVDTP